MQKISLRAARVNAGMTIKDVSKLTGYCEGSVSKWENKKTNPSIAAALTLCKLYNVDVSDVSFC